MLLPHNKNNKWIIVICIGIKVLVLFVLSANLSLLGGFPLIVSHDAISYLKAAHNIANHGTYSLSNLPHEEVAYYTGRMGGYEMFIAFLLLFTSEKIALILLVCFQIIFSVLSSFALAHIAWCVFRSQFVYWCTLLLYMTNTYVSVFDIMILSESFAVSFVIIAIYFIMQEKKDAWHALLSGLLITSAVFFRPFIILLIPAMACYLVVGRSFKVRGVRNISKELIFFLLPFLICETAWIVRNYNVTGKFIPVVSDLHAQINYPIGFSSLMTFVQTWGGDIVWWNPRAEIIAFMKEPFRIVEGNRYSSIEHLPKYIYTADYSADSLKRVKELLVMEADTLLPPDIRYRSGYEASRSLHDYRQSFIAAKPFHFVIYAPIRLLYNFVVHSGTYNISSSSFYMMSLPGKIYKLFYSGLYIFTLFAGLLAMLYCIIFNRSVAILLIAYSGILMMILCPFLLRRIEYRYFVLCYPFLTVYSTYLISYIYRKIKQLLTSD